MTRDGFMGVAGIAISVAFVAALLRYGFTVHGAGNAPASSAPPTFFYAWLVAGACLFTYMKFGTDGFIKKASRCLIAAVVAFVARLLLHHSS